MIELAAAADAELGQRRAFALERDVGDDVEAGEDLLRHVAVLALGDEAREILLGLRIGIRARDAESVEAMLTRQIAQRRLEITAQKSRSA